jgi:hypothetical protein
MTAVLVDLQGRGRDVDLLDHDGLVVGHVQVPPARGAGVQEVVGGRGSEHLGWKQLALMCRMSGLAAGLAPLLAGGRRRLGGLDDIGGRRLGGVRGILASRGELFLQTLDGGLEGGELSAQGIDLSLQPLAIGTRGVVSVIIEAESIRPSAGIQHCERSLNIAPG